MGILDRFKKKEEQKARTPAASEEKMVALVSSAAIKAGAVASNIILSPIVTEKSAHLAAQGQYVFHVDSTANKVQVKLAIRSMYGVMPVSVNIQRQAGKRVRFGKAQGRRGDWKKAIVTLPKGKTIEIYEGV